MDEPNIDTGEDKDEPSLLNNDLIKQQMSDLAQALEMRSRFPVDSLPVFDEKRHEPLEPFEYNKTDTTFEVASDEDAPGMGFSVATDKFQYVKGDQIRAQVLLTGNIPESSHISVTGWLASRKGKFPTPFYFYPDVESGAYRADIDPRVYPDELFTREMMLVASVSIGEQLLQTSAPFHYEDSEAVAVVEGVAPPYIDGSYLTIPLQLVVRKQGPYFIQSLLRDAESGRPLVELQGGGQLELGNASIQLKAHISALKYKNAEGPYTLHMTSIKRLLFEHEPGITGDLYGTSLYDHYPIPRFSFSNYDDEEYVDPDQLEQLELLRGAIGGGNGS